ncbi:MAG: hypothetical protein V2A71_01815 [Candidatus Eisenbacteria bacterium]
MDKKLAVISVAAFVLVAFVASVWAAERVNPCRYQSPDGWRFQFLAQFNPIDIREKVELARKIQGIPPVLRMMLDSQNQYDWLQCGILVPENFCLTLGSLTKAVIKKDSVEVISNKLIFTDNSHYQYWDSQQGEITLGLSEDIDIKSKVDKISLDGGKSKVRAIAYAVYALVPSGSNLTKSNVKEVRLTGVRVSQTTTAQK